MEYLVNIIGTLLGAMIAWIGAVHASKKALLIELKSKEEECIFIILMEIENIKNRLEEDVKIVRPDMKAPFLGGGGIHKNDFLYYHLSECMGKVKDIDIFKFYFLLRTAPCKLVNKDGKDLYVCDKKYILNMINLANLILKKRR